LNLLITTACNLDCSYCFARSLQVHQASQQDRQVYHEMTCAELDKVVSSLDPKKDPVRLMGGEPTLHSKYPEILRCLKSRGFQVWVYTNGIQAALRQMAPLLPDRILLNLNDRSFYSEEQVKDIRENLAYLGERVALGHTINQPDFDLEWHRRLILAEGLQPMIRLGLAQPVIGGDNDYLPDADLPAAHAAVARWAKRLARDGIRLGMDCGFMRCHFSEADLEGLIRAGASLRFECRPVVDVGPGLETWRCYAFAHQEGLNWADFEGEAACREWFARRETNLSQACSQCQHHLNGWCQGGCRARTLMKV
jgi:hypothetical protein